MPLFVQPVVGFRVWRLDRDGTLLPRAVSALHWLDVEPWLPGRNDAVCVYEGRSRAPHRSPDGDCDCGLHACHEVSQVARAARADGCIAGAIAAWGDLQVHRTGFRAQHAQIVALAMPERSALTAPARAAARRYVVPLVDFSELGACAADHGAPLVRCAVPARSVWLGGAAGGRTITGRRSRTKRREVRRDGQLANAGRS